MATTVLTINSLVLEWRTLAELQIVRQVPLAKTCALLLPAWVVASLGVDAARALQQQAPDFNHLIATTGLGYAEKLLRDNATVVIDPAWPENALAALQALGSGQLCRLASKPVILSLLPPTVAGLSAALPAAMLSATNNT